MFRYRRTQYAGWPLAASFTVVIGVTIYAYLYAQLWPMLSIPVFFLILWALFYGLTVTIDDTRLEVRYGRGPISFTFRLDDIADCRIVRNKWYYGWGIRLTPHGWLYNIHGLDAVEIDLKDGRTYRIGTNDPQGLEHHLKAAIEARPSSH